MERQCLKGTNPDVGVDVRTDVQSCNQIFLLVVLFAVRVALPLSPRKFFRLTTSTEPISD